MNSDKDNIIIIASYSELTPEIMINLLKSGLNDFEFGYKIEKLEVPADYDDRDILLMISKAYSSQFEALTLCDYNNGICEKYLGKEEMEYYRSNMDLIFEYITKLENLDLNVGDIRNANRGLEALMWYRDEGTYNEDIYDLLTDQMLLADDLHDAATYMNDNVVGLVKKSNCANLWFHTPFYGKAKLVKEWGYTLMDDPEDVYNEDSSFPYHSIRELKMFETVMGRKFKEFDSLLRK